jgi:hypothetical protein
MKFRIAAFAVTASAAVAAMTAFSSPASAATGELVWTAGDGQDFFVQRTIGNPDADHCYKVALPVESTYAQKATVANNTDSPTLVYTDLNCTTPHPRHAILQPGRSTTSVQSVKFLR